jgi:predicted transposase YbfD/YdcC
MGDLTNQEERNQSFLDFFEDFDDPRVDRKKLHVVQEIMLVTLAAVICGAEGWNDVEKFGKAKIDELRKYLPFENGAPSDDTLRRFFRRIDPSKFKEKFVTWVKTIKLPQGNVIAIDGKVSRHSFSDDKSALHMVSAFASEARLVLAQTSVLDKSNEITAIPTLLDWLDLRGAIVTIDAMGCQRNIAEKIVNSGGDYILALKGNQSNLHEDIVLLFKDKDLEKDEEVNISEEVDAGHGRIETRKCRCLLMPKILQDQHEWPGLKTIIEIYSKREMKKTGEVSEEKRYYISSLDKNAAKINSTIRSHWAIENSLHYILDISFRDDDSRIRLGNAPENIGILKHVALNMLQANKQKRDSIKGLRKIAAWNHARMHSILTQKF